MGGVFLLMDDAAIDAELAAMELTELWGVAHRLARRLTALGITTPLALKQADPRFIRERFNVVLERLVLELRGVACISLEEAPPDRKSIMASRSFGRPVTAAGIAGSGRFLCGGHVPRNCGGNIWRPHTSWCLSRPTSSRPTMRSITPRCRCSCQSRRAIAASSSARRSPASHRSGTTATVTRRPARSP